MLINFREIAEILEACVRENVRTKKSTESCKFFSGVFDFFLEKKREKSEIKNRHFEASFFKNLNPEGNLPNLDR